jgi:hypothetical protein
MDLTEKVSGGGPDGLMAALSVTPVTTIEHALQHTYL